MSNPRIASTANALADLFELSKDNLSDERLAWFAGLLTPAITEAINISSSLNHLAGIYGDSEPVNLPSESEVSNILFGLADQLDNIRALMSVVEESVYMIGERKDKAAQKQQA